MEKLDITASSDNKSFTIYTNKKISDTVNLAYSTLALLVKIMSV